VAASAKGLFTERFIPPKIYLRVLGKMFGNAWLRWEPETLWDEIRDETGASVSDEVRDKIMALRLLLVADNFWEEFTVFENTILAFNDLLVDPTCIQVCLPHELGYGLTVANGVKVKPFDSEISNYIRACCDQDGLMVYHRSFSFAQPRYENEKLRELVNNTRKVWDIERFTQLLVPDGEEDDPVVVQVAKLHDIEVYVRERLDKGMSLKVA